MDIGTRNVSYPEILAFVRAHSELARLNIGPET
jgi:hypothetical protein